MSRRHKRSGNVRKPGVLLSLLPVAFLVGALWFVIVEFREYELSTHIPLVLAAVVAAIVSIFLGHNWGSIEKGMVGGISHATGAILILLVIGFLVATWIQAGIVPTMVVYGLKLLSPPIFLAATCIICSVVSLATGSSWSTAATVGIALIGIGEGLGISRPMVAGAIISGSYFGDKMSPLSDTTNLAPAMAGSTLFDHIRHMAYTTGPSFFLALVGFVILGVGSKGDLDTARIDQIQTAIESIFVIHPLLLLPPLLVIGMVVFKLPALPALIGGSLLGAIVAITVQDAGLGDVLTVAYSGMKTNSGNALVDELLSRGGFESMFSTVALIICALSFGGIMEHSGMLAAIAKAVLRLAKGVGGLISATLVTCLGMNILASDQYLAIVVPGRMYKEAYDRKGLAAVNLSRALEDSGTLTSPLIPWNTCGAFMIATLGLDPWVYVPFCFLNLLNPFVSAFYGFTGITIRKVESSEVKAS